MAANVELRDVVRASLVAAAVAVCTGCIGPGPRIRTALKTPSPAPAADLATGYTLSCPDAIDVRFAKSPTLSGRYRLAADGAIELSGVGRVFVEGQTAAGAEMQLANAVGDETHEVRVAVAEYNSRLILVFGPSGDQERAAAYQGPESTVEFLRRIGGLSDQANFVEIHVVRPHVAADRRPEVFHVNLEEILIKGDDSSNVVLQPYDHVYVGATKRSVYAHYLPGVEWARKPTAR